MDGEDVHTILFLHMYQSEQEWPLNYKNYHKFLNFSFITTHNVASISITSSHPNSDLSRAASLNPTVSFKLVEINARIPNTFHKFLDPFSTSLTH